MSGAQKAGIGLARGKCLRLAGCLRNKQECEQHFSCDLRFFAEPRLNQFSVLKAVGMRGRDRMFQCCSCCTVATRPLTCLVFEVRFSYKAMESCCGRGVLTRHQITRHSGPLASSHPIHTHIHTARYPAIAGCSSRRRRQPRSKRNTAPAIAPAQLQACNQTSSRSLSPQPSD